MRIILGPLAAISLPAAPIMIGTSGIFSSSTPTSSFTAANAPFALSFAIDSNPVVSNVSAGRAFDAVVSAFNYTFE